MSTLIPFTKMHGLGNDFVVLNNVDQELELSKKLIIAMANRHRGIGCDQVLVVEPSPRTDADFLYRIFNADGSEVSQCGNGARCLAKFLCDKKLTDKQQITLLTQHGLLKLNLNGEDIAVDMGSPNAIQKQAFENVHFISLSLGNPHAVILVDDVLTANVQSMGSALNYAEIFPDGVNVGFMQVVNKNQIKLRVYERGVGETQACGSGACAAVVAGCVQNLLHEKVVVELPGGELTIAWQDRSSVIMTGPATIVFEGNFVWDE